MSMSQSPDWTTFSETFTLHVHVTKPWLDHLNLYFTCPCHKALTGPPFLKPLLYMSMSQSPDWTILPLLRPLSFSFFKHLLPISMIMKHWQGPAPSLCWFLSGRKTGFPQDNRIKKQIKCVLYLLVCRLQNISSHPSTLLRQKLL